MRILLTGVSGQVGWELQRSLMTLGEVITVGRESNQSVLRMDLSQPNSIVNVVREVQPDLIINPAAYTAVDKAEIETELAMAVNGVAPGVLAEEAKRCHASLIHFSTDYVFDGNQRQPYTELDSPNPQNVYGKTKLAGEQAIQSSGVPFLIFRTAWVYSTRGKNFLLTMLRLAKDQEILKVVADQIGSPTWSRMIAESSAQVIAQGQSKAPVQFYEWMERYQGIYHLTSRGETSWHEFAEAIFELNLDQSRKLKSLVPIPSREYPTPASRPSYSLLDTHKFSEAFGLTLPNWRNALELSLDNE